MNINFQVIFNHSKGLRLFAGLKIFFKNFFLYLNGSKALKNKGVIFMLCAYNLFPYFCAL